MASIFASLLRCPACQVALRWGVAGSGRTKACGVCRLDNYEVLNWLTVIHEDYIKSWRQRTAFGI